MRKAVSHFMKQKGLLELLAQEQVRKPINKEGMERWKPYAKNLKPLLNALDADLLKPEDINMSTSRMLMNNFNSTIESKPRKNIQFLGLKLTSSVFFISSGLAIIFSCLVLVYPETSNQFLSDTRNFVVSRFDTFFTLCMSAFTIIISF